MPGLEEYWKGQDPFANIPKEGSGIRPGLYGAASRPVLPTATGDVTKDWRAARETYDRVVSMGMRLGKSPDEIKTELTFRGVANIDPFKPPQPEYLSLKEGETIYERTPQGLREAGKGGPKKPTSG